MHIGDIAIHGGIALGVVAMLGALGAHWIAAALVSGGFLLREEIQGLEKYAVWLTPWHWSAQKLAEGWVPVVAAVLVALAWQQIFAARRRRKLKIARARRGALAGAP